MFFTRNKKDRRRLKTKSQGKLLLAVSHLSLCGYAVELEQPERERIDVLANEYLPSGTVLIEVARDGIFTKVRKLSADEMVLWGIGNIEGGLV